MIRAVRFILFVMIVLFPIELDREPHDHAANTAPNANPSVKLAPPSSEAMKLRRAPQVDREAFLSSFRRQAGAELVSCVRKDIGETGRLGLVARLSQNGELSAVRGLDRSMTGAPCVKRLISAMKFPAHLIEGADSIEIEWRFDW